MLRNLSHKYFSHSSNIKYIGLTIKYIKFESIYYAINLIRFHYLWFLAILILYFYPYIINLNKRN